MFGQLLIKECRQTAKSLIYWLIILVLIFVFATQIGEMDILKKARRTTVTKPAAMRRIS